MAIPDVLPPDLSYGPEVGWDRLKIEVVAEISRAEEDVAHRRKPDYAAYCEAVGYIRGLRRVLEIEEGMTDAARAGSGARNGPED